MVVCEQASAETGRSTFREVAERLRILVVAGVAVGVLVAGVGSRLAMLLLRLTSADSVRGLVSDDGFTIGQVTLGGTYNLLMLGAVVGIIGAAAYRAVAPWLLGPQWFRRVTTATGSGVVVGSMLVHADGIDFRVLKPTWLATGLFVALPALFGAVIGPAVDGVSAIGSWTARGATRWLLPVVLIVLFPMAVPVVVVAALVLMVWVPARRLIGSQAERVAVGVIARGLWLTIAAVGAVALVADVMAIV